MSAGERVYRALLLLYPRAFRRDYGAEMLQLSREQHRDGARSWARLAADVVVTAPARHQEALRAMSTPSKLVTAAIVTTIGIVAFAMVGGALFALILMLVLAWILTALLRERGARPTSGAWWKLATSGAGVFAVAFVVFALPWPDSWRETVPGDVAWFVGFLMIVTSIVLVATGLLMGAVAVGSRRRLTR